MTFHTSHCINSRNILRCMNLKNKNVFEKKERFKSIQPEQPNTHAEQTKLFTFSCPSAGHSVSSSVVSFLSASLFKNSSTFFFGVRRHRRPLSAAVTSDRLSGRRRPRRELWHLLTVHLWIGFGDLVSLFRSFSPFVLGYPAILLLYH